MIAADSGYFHALTDQNDAWHVRAVACHQRLAGEDLITTWPVLTEVGQLLLSGQGADFAVNLMADVADVADVADGGIAIWEPGEAGASRMVALMRKYASQPMDLADASLVLLAEHLGHGRIVTTDLPDFSVYRWSGRKPFKNLLEENPT